MTNEHVPSRSIAPNEMKKTAEGVFAEGIPNPRAELTLKALESATRRVSANVDRTRRRALTSLVSTIVVGLAGFIIAYIASANGVAYLLVGAILAGAVGTTIGLFFSVPSMRIQRKRMENLRDVVRYEICIPMQASSEEHLTQRLKAPRNDDTRN
jgi:hypothetical protein